MFSIKPDVKKTVDEIFMRLASNESVKKMYDLWCEMEQQKHDVYSSAKVQFPNLVDNKEFRAVKNMIVQTVLQMDFQHPGINVEMPEIADENTDQFKNEILANTIFGLFVNLSRCIEDDYQRKFKSGRKMIDSKLRRMIQEKNQALGIKQENGQTLEY